ncbi:MAG: hypothetical protein ACYC9Q_11820 [Bacillota bacterium]
MKTQDVRSALADAFSRFRFNSDPRDDALQAGLLFALRALKLVNHRQYIRHCRPRSRGQRSL